MRPDEMTNWEFLNEQLYQIALKGGYQKEFNEVKERLPSLNAYQNAGEFMKALWNDKPLRERIVEQLKQLWRSDSGVPTQSGQDDYDFRQSSGTVLLLAMWRNAIGAGDDYWSDLFIGLAKPQINTDSHGLNGGAL